MRRMIAAVLASLAVTSAQAATFTYVGGRLTGVAGTGFTRVVFRFTVPGPILPNSTYTAGAYSFYNDGVNKLPQLTTYLAEARANGGQLNSFQWGTITTGPTGKPVSWTFKTDLAFNDALGSEGYELYVNGPGNEATCPIAVCGHDSLYTTLPETLLVGYSFTSTAFGTLTWK